MYIYTYARLRFTRPRILLFQDEEMKLQRLDVIREVLAQSPVGSQDELRKKLRRRGIDVTQATLSRDIHTLQLVKGPKGYSLPHSGHGTAVAPEDDDTPPSIEEMGGAQTTAAALDRAGWPEVIGTIAGDDTVLIICPDVRRAGEIEHRMRTLLES